MTTKSLMEQLGASRNIYSALELLKNDSGYQVDLEAFGFYKDIDDRAKLHMMAEQSATVDDFVRTLKAADSDLSHAIAPSPPAKSQVTSTPLLITENTSPHKNRPSRSRYSSLGFFLGSHIPSTDRSRDDELTELAIILNKRTSNNIILCAPPGVGKTHLVESFASSADCRFDVFLLDLPRIIAGTKYRGELESKLVTIIEASIAEGFVLFVDEIHTLATTRNAEGGVNLLDILKPYLVQADFRMIGATTPAEVDSLRLDAAFSRRFTFLRLSDLSRSQIFAIFIDFLQNSNLRTMLEDSFEEIVTSLDSRVPDRNYPDKLIDYLEYAESFLATLGPSHSEHREFLSASMSRFLHNRFV